MSYEFGLESRAFSAEGEAPASTYDHLGGCGCPVCRGQVQVIETPNSFSASEGLDPLGPQAYLNADQRADTIINGKTSFTIDRAGLQLTGFTTTTNADGSTTLVAAPGWGGVAGRAFTVTYAYRASEPFTMPDDAGGFARFNTAQINQAELALQAWADVANITFLRVGSGVSGEAAYSNNAAILLGNYTTGVDGAAAFAMYPGSTSASRSDGDVWINSSISYNAAPTVGNYGGQVLIHELGHAIGLAHPGEYNADATTTFTYATNAEYYEDTRQYTVMSYFGEGNTGASYQGNYAAAPQLDDIRGAQIEYGANMSTRLGNTVYGFNATADRPWFIANGSTQKLVFAVWDAGGVDTFDFSGYLNNQTIDLRAGFFSNVGGLVGNVAIAQGATIENAIGGAGSDIIHGNAAANRILGSAGNDTIDGGTGGLDYLRGDDGNDLITGGADFDDINGNRGSDTAHGNGGDDWVVGGQDDDRLWGDVGSDIVYGNMGADSVEGGVGADVVRGGQGNDLVFGGDGNDWLSGDRGDDTITGGAGADIFSTFQDAGIDRITDFNFAEGDRVHFETPTTYTVSQVGADVVIAMGAGHQMVLAGVQLASLGSGWIV
jgi:serralysin